MHTHRRWLAGGIQDYDDDKDNVWRTALRAPSGTASILKQDGTIDPVLEQTQYDAWRVQCWYIEEPVEEKPKPFPPLKRDYITRKIDEWQAGKSLEVQ